MKPLVKNAADEAQVKEAEGKVRRGRDRELEDLRVILSTPHGRRFMWRLMGHCRVHGSIWEPSAKIHYNSGQQDIGHFLQAEIVEAGEQFYFQMMKEAKENLNNV
jgi:hypothetical protein